MKTKHIDVFFANYKNQSYRANIQRLLKRVNKEKAERSIIAEINWLPKDVKKQFADEDGKVNHDGLEFFIEINNMVTLVNTFTCEQAFNFIMGHVMTSFDLKKYIKKNEDCTKNEKNKEISFGFYQIATLHLTHAAHSSKQVRQVMGIKKGIFFT